MSESEKESDPGTGIDSIERAMPSLPEVPVSLEKAPSDDEEQQLPPPQDDFKEGGFGWVVIIAVAVLNAHTWGLNSSYAVFLAHYLKNNTFAATPLGYAFVGGLSISIALAASPLATFLAGWSRYGTRWAIFTGIVFEVIGFIGSSFASELWHLALSQGVSFGIGLGLTFVPSAAVPPQWFKRRRSFASAVTAAGSGFGGLIYSLATNAMIERFGLAWTFRALAIICFVVNSVATYFIRDRNKAVGSVTTAFNLVLFKRAPFVLFQLFLIFSIIGYIILVFSIVAYCQSVGLSAVQASLVGALFNLGQGIGRPIIGISSDYVGRFNVAMLSTLWCGILCLFVWTFGARSFGACIIFGLLSGSVAGTMWASFGPICAEVVGLPLLPSALSMTWIVLVLPATFAEPIALSLRKSGVYEYIDVQLFTGFLYIGAFLFGWILRAWKVWEMEQTHLRKEEEERMRDSEGQASGRLHRTASRASTVKEKILHLKGLWAIQRV
ncbi:MFS general substrate transporter [Xylariaceae sp. FL0255]|nr:MFS general substrate transporter [Xylariaceae sp. FL0255]